MLLILSDCELRLRKLGHITLPVTGEAYWMYGEQANFLVGFKDSPHFYYYEYESGTFNLVWQKLIPKQVKFDCWKYMSPRGEFYLQTNTNKVCLFDHELHLIRTLSSPGGMRCLLPGGERAMIDNYCSPSAQTDGLRLSISPATDLHRTHYPLEVPAEGPYAKVDPVRACGLDDGRVAVVVREKPFCDLYDASGE
jgi:hypothetical protein